MESIDRSHEFNILFVASAGVPVVGRFVDFFHFTPLRSRSI